MWILHQTSSGFTSKNHWVTRQELKRRIKAAAEGETTLQAVLGPARTALGRHAGPGEPTGAHPLTLAHSSHLHSAPLPTQPWRAEVWCRQSKSHRSISLRHGTAPYDSRSLHPGRNPASQLRRPARSLTPHGFLLPSPTGSMPTAEPSSLPLTPSSLLGMDSVLGGLCSRQGWRARARHSHSSLAWPRRFPPQRDPSDRAASKPSSRGLNR